jgi:hypothetical protein
MAGMTRHQIKSSLAPLIALAEPFNAGDQKVTLLGGNQGNQVSKSTYDFGNNYGLLSIRNL